jgi:hypothetical protein
MLSRVPSVLKLIIAVIISFMVTAVSISSLRGIEASANSKYLMVYQSCVRTQERYLNRDEILQTRAADQWHAYYNSPVNENDKIPKDLQCFCEE